MNNSTDIPGSTSAQSPELAGRGARLMAVVVDGLIGLPFGFLVLVYSGGFELLLKHQPLPAWLVALQFFSGLATFYLINSYLLIKEGQTIGKYFLRVRIVDMQGGIPPFWKIALVRYLPTFVLSLIGFVGGLISMIDSLLIFRQSRRCLHDLIAGTRVVEAPVRAPQILVTKRSNS